MIPLEPCTIGRDPEGKWGVMRLPVNSGEEIVPVRMGFTSRGAALDWCEAHGFEPRGRTAALFHVSKEHVKEFGLPSTVVALTGTIGMISLGLDSPSARLLRLVSLTRREWAALYAVECTRGNARPAVMRALLEIKPE